MEDGHAGDRHRPAGGIAGQVTTRSGKPVVGATLMIVGESPDHLDIAAVTGASGRYSFGDLTPGEYDIQANAGSRLQTQHVRVRSGEVARLDFVTDD
jgi:hypothetical protein